MRQIQACLARRLINGGSVVCRVLQKRRESPYIYRLRKGFLDKKFDLDELLSGVRWLLLSQYVSGGHGKLRREAHEITETAASTMAAANSLPRPRIIKNSAADGARHALAQAFLARSVSMLQRVISSASTEALKSALSLPTDIGGVASLLSDLAPHGVDLSAADPFIEAMARGAEHQKGSVGRRRRKPHVRSGGNCAGNYTAGSGQAARTTRFTSGPQRFRRVFISGVPVYPGVV